MMLGRVIVALLLCWSHSVDAEDHSGECELDGICAPSQSPETSSCNIDTNDLCPEGKGPPKMCIEDLCGSPAPSKQTCLDDACLPPSPPAHRPCDIEDLCGPAPPYGTPGTRCDIEDLCGPAPPYGTPGTRCDIDDLCGAPPPGTAPSPAPEPAPSPTPGTAPSPTPTETSAPGTAPTPAPSSSTAPAPTPVPTTSEAVAVQVTKFESEVKMDDVSKFDATTYTEAVAAAAGVDRSSVVVTDVDYQIKVGYSLPVEITESQAIKAVADHQSVVESAVKVISNRRLSATSRLLGAHLKAIQMAITTKYANDVDLIANKATETSTLAQSFSKIASVDVPEVTISSQPEKSVQVKTEIETMSSTAVAAPTESLLAGQLSSRLATSGIEVSVANVETTTRTTETMKTTQTSTEEEDDDDDIGIIIGAIAGGVVLLGILAGTGCWCMRRGGGKNEENGHMHLTNDNGMNGNNGHNGNNGNNGNLEQPNYAVVPAEYLKPIGKSPLADSTLAQLPRGTTVLSV